MPPKPPPSQPSKATQKLPATKSQTPSKPPTTSQTPLKPPQTQTKIQIAPSKPQTPGKTPTPSEPPPQDSSAGQTPNEIKSTGTPILAGSLRPKRKESNDSDDHDIELQETTSKSRTPILIRSEMSILDHDRFRGRRLGGRYGLLVLGIIGLAVLVIGTVVSIVVATSSSGSTNATGSYPTMFSSTGTAEPEPPTTTTTMSTTSPTTEYTGPPTPVPNCAATFPPTGLTDPSTVGSYCKACFPGDGIKCDEACCKIYYTKVDRDYLDCIKLCGP